MTGAGVGVSINESTQLGIVITGLEIVERGLSILGLTAMSVHMQFLPTRNLRFRVGILDIRWFLSVLGLATKSL